MSFKELPRLSRVRPLMWSRSVLIALLVSIVLGICVVPVSSIAHESPNRYQVVTGTDDKAYLVDTASGFVWVLTYRTMATGREPIAVPYKFLKICPKNQKAFLVEDVKDGACLP